MRILQRFFKDSVTALSFRENSLGDQVLQATLMPFLQSFRSLRKLELSNNMLSTQCLESLARLFEVCSHIEELDLSRNFIGSSSQRTQNAGETQRAVLEFFLQKLFTELDRPKSLDLSFNQLSDECLFPLIKYTFANYECELTELNLDGNRFTP